MNIRTAFTTLVRRLHGTFHRSPELSPEAQALFDKLSAIVDEEVERSEEFGLSICPEHLVKEKWAVLLAVLELGNVNLPNGYGGPDFLFQILYESLLRLMEEEARFYFERLKEQNLTTNMYQAHLTMLCSRIAYMIRNRELG